MRIPFGEVKREVAEIRAELEEAMRRVLDRGWFVLGEECERFEEEFARFVGARHAVSCGNGTDAVELALRAVGSSAGDRVVTVANTCVPTATGIRNAGCALRLVDCEADTLQMDASRLEAALDDRARAVVPVHLYGASPNMERVHAVCAALGVPVVEDCAQAHGARAGVRPAGRWGVAAAWSFYPSKNLGALGDGGAVTTDDPALAERLRRLRNYGQRVRYHHDSEGRNSRLDEIQAAALRVKLGHVTSWNERRRSIADRYRAGLEGRVRLPDLGKWSSPCWHLFPIRVPASKRDQLQADLEERGVLTQIHYPIPIHRQLAYRHLFPGESYEAAEQAAGELISLPLYPQLSDEEVEYVIEQVGRGVAAVGAGSR